MSVVETVEAYVVAERRDVLEAILACADRVSLAEPADREAVVESFEDCLEARELGPALIGTLRGAVEAAGYELPVEPVPAPPYLVVTGRGPMLRATVEDGRIVVELAAFRLDREAGGYVRRTDDPEALPVARFRGV